MESTWESRDLVVLDAAVKFVDQSIGRLLPQAFDLVEVTGLAGDDVTRALLALNGRFIELRKSMGDALQWTVATIYPEAREAVGQWPTPDTLADRLVRALADAADRESDEERRGWLRKTAGWLGAAGRDVAVEVAAAALSRGTGLA